MFPKATLITLALALVASANPIVESGNAARDVPATKTGVRIPLHKRGTLTNEDGTFNHEKAVRQIVKLKKCVPSTHLLLSGAARTDHLVLCSTASTVRTLSTSRRTSVAMRSLRALRSSPSPSFLPPCRSVVPSSSPTSRMTLSGQAKSASAALRRASPSTSILAHLTSGFPRLRAQLAAATQRTTPASRPRAPRRAAPSRSATEINPLPLAHPTPTRVSIAPHSMNAPS